MGEMERNGLHKMQEHMNIHPNKSNASTSMQKPPMLTRYDSTI